MDPMQSAQQSMPHIVQVYRPSITNTKIQNPQIIHISHPSLLTPQGKVTYQQTITSESLHIPTAEHVTEIQSQQIQNQIVMSCQQTHLQTIPTVPSIQPQVMQGECPPLQFASVLLPHGSLFKQHMLVDSTQQYFGQYEFIKEPECVVTKVELGHTNGVKEIKCKTDSKPTKSDKEPSRTKKRTRSQFPDPNSWACNVRKQKHQKGEAYINRRGKYVPERKVRNTKNCLTSCKYKCNELISDTDREHIFKAFYSLNANEKKHFLLNTTERNIIQHSKLQVPHKRKYNFKYFFLVRAVRYTVCKNFYLGTLAISQKPVYNVHLSKSDMNIPKPDGRGLSEASAHALPSETKQRVRSHITSFKTDDCKPVKQFSRKKQYLEPSLSIKRMYSMYLSDCIKDNVESVKESMYRTIFKKEFNLHFKKIKAEPLCHKCKGEITRT